MYFILRFGIFLTEIFINTFFIILKNIFTNNFFIFFVLLNFCPKLFGNIFFFFNIHFTIKYLLNKKFVQNFCVKFFIIIFLTNCL